MWQAPELRLPETPQSGRQHSNTSRSRALWPATQRKKMITIMRPHVHLHRFHLNSNYISSMSQISHCFIWIQLLLTLAQSCSNLAESSTLQHKTTVSDLCPFTQFIKVIMPWHILKSNTLSLCKWPYPSYLRPRQQISFQHCGKYSWQIQSCNIEFNGSPPLLRMHISVLEAFWTSQTVSERNSSNKTQVTVNLLYKVITAISKVVQLKACTN